MNDQDYMRKGVELAGGSHRYFNEPAKCSEIYLVDVPVCYCRGDIAPDWIKDALAAQLVRQVDASSPSSVAIYHGSTQVFADSGFTRRKGDDRPINTIKAIVDSGVLG